MEYLDEDPVAEIHRIRTEIMNEFSSFEAWGKYLDAERPRLIKEGWNFITPEEAAARKQKPQNATIIAPAPGA
jgi:hypothetical protein